MSHLRNEGQRVEEILALGAPCISSCEPTFIARREAAAKVSDIDAYDMILTTTLPA
jgi:hypothetical protein